MKVKMMAGQVGPFENRKPGDVVEVGDAEGIRLIQRGLAVPHRAAEAEQAVLGIPETTSARPAETAVAAGAKASGRKPRRPGKRAGKGGKKS